jgi:hypothetical protein
MVESEWERRQTGFFTTKSLRHKETQGHRGFGFFLCLGAFVLNEGSPSKANKKTGGKAPPVHLNSVFREGEAPAEPSLHSD